MPWGTVAVQKGKECHSLIEDIEIPAADSALGARFFLENLMYTTSLILDIKMDYFMLWFTIYNL